MRHRGMRSHPPRPSRFGRSRAPRADGREWPIPGGPMLRRMSALTIVTLCALALAGCATRKTVLPYAVYADQVPIYPGAVLKDAMGSTSAGDTPESGSDGMAWFFDVKAPADEMVAFYQQRLPQAKRDAEWGDGVRLVWVPEG